MSIESETNDALDLASRPSPSSMRVLTGRSFATVVLEDGSVGVAMDYSRYPAVSSIDVAVHEEVREIDDSSRVGTTACDLRSRAIRIALLNARSRPLLRIDALRQRYFRVFTTSYADERASRTPTQATEALHDAIGDAEHVAVIGFGGFMELFAMIPQIQRVTVVDLHTKHRLRRINTIINRINKKYGSNKVLLSDDLNSAIRSSDLIQITGSCLSNGTADDLLEVINGAPLIVTGATGAIAPEVWFNYNAKLICTEVRDERFVDAYRYDDHLYEWFVEYDERLYILP